jgi:hypothetical protein
METTLENLIGTTLDELEKVKGNPNKQRYLIEEVVMELSVSSIETNRTGLNFKIINYGEKKEGENTHKITVKLKPKNIRVQKPKGGK